MTRQQLNKLLTIAINEHEKYFAEWFCGKQTPETLKKLSRAQDELEMVREQIKALNRPTGAGGFKMTIFNWRGPGWYACRQEGSYENQHVEYYQCGSNKEYSPDTRNQGLGTPAWYFKPPKNPDIEVRKTDIS